MKVLHIEDRFHPGLGYQINNFAKLHNSGIEFHIISSDSFYPWKGSDPQEILTILDNKFEEKYNVVIHRAGILFEIHSRVWIKKLKRIVLNINPDIIYAHGVETFTAIRIILSDLSKKYKVFTDTHTLLGQSKNKLLGCLFNVFLKRLVVPSINKKNIIVFYTTEENGMILRDVYGIREENIKSCLIGTDTSKFYYDKAQRELLRSEYGMKEKDIAIIYAGKHNNIKKPHLVLEVVRKMETGNVKKLFLFFVGSKDSKYFKEYFKEDLDLDFKIFYIPEIENDELYKYYSMADIAVFPKENSLSALDVQACKLPVVLEDNPTNRNRIKESGLLYKKNNLSDLTEKITEFVVNDDLRKRSGENGLNFVKDVYDYKKIISEVEKILLESETKKTD